jgi:hypothetical protein
MKIKLSLALAVLLLLGLLGTADSRAVGSRVGAPISGLLSSANSSIPTSDSWTETPLGLAETLYPALLHLPDGGQVQTDPITNSWWVTFDSAPPAPVEDELAALGAGFGYALTPPISAGQDATLQPQTMSTSQLIAAGLPLPFSSPGTPAYNAWLTNVRVLLPKLTVPAENPQPVVAAPLAWYSETVNSSNWAGYEDYQNSYGEIQVQFDMAQVGTNLPVDYGIVQWAGLGGDAANDNGFWSLVQSGGAIYNLGDGTVRQLFIEALSSNTTTQCWDNYSYGSISPGDNLWAEEDGGSLVKFDNTYYTSWKSIVNDVTNGHSSGWQAFYCPSDYVNNSAEAILETPLYGFSSSGSQLFTWLPSFSSTAQYWNDYTYPPGGEQNGEVAPYKLINLRDGSRGNATPTNWTSETSFGVNNGT